MHSEEQAGEGRLWGMGSDQISSVACHAAPTQVLAGPLLPALSDSAVLPLRSPTLPPPPPPPLAVLTTSFKPAAAAASIPWHESASRPSGWGS